MLLAVYSQNCFPQLHLSFPCAAATAFAAAFGPKAATPPGPGSDIPGSSPKGSMQGLRTTYHTREGILVKSSHLGAILSF